MTVIVFFVRWENWEVRSILKRILSPKSFHEVKFANGEPQKFKDHAISLHTLKLCI